VKKILSAIPGDSSFLKPSLLTFRQLGWEIRNVDYRKTDFLAAIKNNLRLARRAASELITQNRPSIKRVINNNEIIRVAKLWHPDLFLTFKGEIILPETILSLKQLSVKTVNWYPDHLLNTPQNSKFIAAYDCFIYWDKWRISIYHKQGLKNVFYLPFCTIPEKTFPSSDKKYQINFIANWHAHREKKVAPVRDMGLMIWGNQKWEKTALGQNYQWGPTTVPQMIKIIRATKISLNVHVVEQIYSEGTNVRPFEVTGAGGFLLSNVRKSLYELFKVGREIEVFDSDEELVEKTKFYLKNDRLREKIARAGWERTKRDHTYLKRFTLLLKYLN